jgi:hypothetical protein
MSRWERGAIVLAPLAAVVTMGVGLRIGASPSVHAAVVYGAPPSADRAGLAWQLLTILDDRSVRESVPMSGVTVLARAGGREARWEGATNADGVAEMWLDLPNVAPGDAVSLEVTAPGEKAPLASGGVAWPADSRRYVPSRPVFARPSKQEGDLQIDVAVYGRRLVPDSPFSRIWVRVAAKGTGVPVAGVTVSATPGPGLSLGTETRLTTDAAGWAMLYAAAQIHVVEMGLRAELRSDGATRSGEWYGALPVAPGAAFVEMPLEVAAEAPVTFDIGVPTVLPRVYAEIDDEVGRATAAVLDVERSEAGAHAVLHGRPLPSGNYWLITAGDPRGAEGFTGAALARPFVVAPPGAKPAADLGPLLATREAPRFSRFVALDGLPGRRQADGGRRRRGLFLAFGSLGIAAALETLLILRGVERARRDLSRVAEMLDGNDGTIERRFSAASLVIGLLLALLGFALLAALLTWKAS